MSGRYPAASESNIQRIVGAIRDLFEGRSNAMGGFTCTPNQASTTVAHPNIGVESRILITPTSVNAAAEYGNGTIYVSAKAPGSFTVTHANSAVSGRTFDFSIAG